MRPNARWTSGRRRTAEGFGDIRTREGHQRLKLMTGEVVGADGLLLKQLPIFSVSLLCSRVPWFRPRFWKYGDGCGGDFGYRRVPNNFSSSSRDRSNPSSVNTTDLALLRGSEM